MKVTDHGTHYTISGKGDFHKISKKGLSKDTHGMIQKLAHGGIANKYDENMADGDEVDPNASKASDLLDNPQDQDEKIANSISQQFQPTQNVPNLPAGDTNTRQPTQTQENPLQQQSANALETYQQAQKDILSGMQNQANVIGQQGQQQAGAIDTEMQRHQKALDEVLAHRNEIQQKMDQVSDEVLNDKLDPKRIWHQASTGKKIIGAIGMALSGIGAGLGGQPNQFNRIIDQDIEAQKVNMANKKTALGMYMQQYRDAGIAESQLRLDMIAATEAQMKKAAAQFAGPQAQANYQIAKGQLQQQAIPVMNDLAMKKYIFGQTQDINSAQSNLPPEKLIPFLVPKDQQKQAFHEIGQAQTTVKNSKVIMDAFDRASQENTVLRTGAGMVRTPESILRMRALMLPIIHDAEGRVNEFEQKTTSDLEPKPGDLDSKVAAKREGLKDFLLQKMEAPTARGFGVPVPQMSGEVPRGK